MRRLLDTNILIDMLRGNEAISTQLRQANRPGVEFTTSAIAVAEVYAGIRMGEEARTTDIVERLHCFGVSRSIGQRAGEMKAKWGRQGRTLTLTDTMIAATVLEHGLPLMTKKRNKKDFPEEGVIFYPAW